MKILILKSNLINPSILDQGLALAKLKAQTINLSLEFDVQTTTRAFTSIPFSGNDVVSGGYEVSPNEIYLEEQKFSPSDVTCLVYNPDSINPKPTNPADNGLFLQIPENWYVTYPEVFVQYFFHELSHEVAWKYGKVDLTHLLNSGTLQTQYADLYLKWKQLQPTDYYLWLISQNLTPQLAHNDPSYKYDTLTGQLNTFYTPPQAPITNVSSSFNIVYIHRFSDDGTQTLGDLTYNDFKCKTLEKSWQNNKTNISCIPTGQYNVKWVHTLRFPLGVYQVQNVVGRSGIDFHSGNTFFDTAGCIILGTSYDDVNHDRYADIINSRSTVAKFEALLGKRDFTLIIT